MVATTTTLKGVKEEGGTSVWVRKGTDGEMIIRVCRGSSAPVPVVPRPDPLRPASLYKATARDVLPALWQPRVHENHVRGNVIPSTGL